MAKQKTLSHEETMGLITEAQIGNESAMERLVECNIRLIWSVVQRFNNRGYDPDDLFQIGSIGFMKAVKKFSMEYTVKFSTYAVPMIVGEILRFFRDDGAVHVSRAIKDLAKKIRALELHTKDPEVFLKALQEKGVETTLEKVKEAQEYMKSRVMSTDEAVYAGGQGEEEITLGEQLGGDMNEGWAENMELREALNQLESRDRKIMELRYFKDLTQAEVANELSISQVQVSRLEKKILAKMRTLMEEKDMAPAYTVEQKDEAIKLLKETELTLAEISKKTTVPMPTLGYWSKTVRDPAVTAKNLLKARKARKAKTVTPVIKEEVFMGEKDLEKKKAKEAKKAEKRKAQAEAAQKAFAELGINPAGTTTGRLKSSEPNKAQVPKKAEPQTVIAEDDNIVVLNDKGEEVFKVKDNTPKVAIIADTEVNPVTNIEYVCKEKLSIKPAIHFDVSVKFGGESVTKDQAVESLYEAYQLVKKLPTDKLSVSISVNN